MDESIGYKDRTINTQEFSYEDKDYSVPEFYAYDNKSTKWIITLLSTQDGLKRLSLMGKENSRLFETYFQIPDEPRIFSKSKQHAEQHAYHSNGVLYLNPLGIAVYMKQSEAVRVLLKLKNKFGARIIHPNEICFVQQRSAQQVADKPCNDLQSTYPALIAVRRGFSEGLSLLMNAGYIPQKEFGIISRKGDGETLSIYRDLVDYALDLLRTKPGINITNIIKTITNPTIRNSYDIYTYDVEINPETEQVEWVSVFRRVAQMGAKNNYASHRNGVAIISVLETLQRLGFLKGLIYENKDVSNTPLPHRSIGSAMSIMVDKNIKSQKPVEKINRNNMIDDPNAYSRVTYDRDASIGAILIWYQLILQTGRGIQKEKIELLISKCLWDTESVKLFFGLENEQIALVFNNWIDNSSQEIRPETIRYLRNAILHQYTYVQKLYLPFIKKYHFEPKDLIRRGPVPFNVHQIINPEWIKRPLYFQENADTNPSRHSEMLADNSQQEVKSLRDFSTKDSITVVAPQERELANNRDEKNNKQQEMSPEPNNVSSRASKKNHSVSYATEPLGNRHTKQVNFDSSMTEYSNAAAQESKRTVYVKTGHKNTMPENGDTVKFNSNEESYRYMTMTSPKPKSTNYTQKIKSKNKPTKKIKKREIRVQEETESESDDSCGSGSTVEIIKTKVNRKTKQKHQTVYKVKGGKSVKKYDLDNVGKQVRAEPMINNYGDSNICMPKQHFNSMGQQLTVIEVDDDHGDMYLDRRGGDNASPSSVSSPDVENNSAFLIRQTNQQNCRINSGVMIEKNRRLPQSIASTALDHEEMNNYSDDDSSKTSTTKSSSSETIRKSDSPRSNCTNTPPRFEKSRVIEKPIVKSDLPNITIKDSPKNVRVSSRSSVDTNTGGTTNIQNTMSAIMRQFVLNMNASGALKLMR